MNNLCKYIAFRWSMSSVKKFGNSDICRAKKKHIYIGAYKHIHSSNYMWVFCEQCATCLSILVYVVSDMVIFWSRALWRFAQAIADDQFSEII